MNEAACKRKLVEEVNGLLGGLGWAQRWEDRWSPGILDLVIKLPGRPIIFAEGKLVKHQSFGPTPIQYMKGLAMIRADVTVLLLGWKSKQLMAVSRWAPQAKWDDCFVGPTHPGTLEGYFAHESR